jgi:AraC-like DNA-binding protein
MHSKDQYFSLPAAYLKLFMQHAAATGLDLEPLLEGTGLDAENLRKSDQAVDFRAVRRVLGRVTKHFGEGWHLALGERFTVPAHGALGFAVVTAPDLRSAIEVLLRYFGIRGPFLWPSGAVEGEEYVIRFYESQAMGEQRRLLIELALLSMQSLIERPLGDTLRGARLAFALPKPAYHAALERSFHAELDFSAKRHSLRLPLDWLQKPCAMHDAAMHRYLLARCEEELRETAGGLPAEVAVRQALLATPGRMPGLGEIAAAQNVSARTLIRRLKRGGTSYGAIREGVRRTLATDYLANSDLGINRIAYRLGYQDPSNFGRAFRGWFGESPGRFRKNARTR